MTASSDCDQTSLASVGRAAIRLASQVKAIFLARGVEGLLGLLGTIVVGRVLTHREFGYFAFFTAAAVLAQELSGEGLEAALVRFGHGSQRDDEAASAVWGLKLRVGMLVTAVLWVGAGILRGLTATDPGYVRALGFAGCFSIVFTWYRYLLARLQADRNFVGYALAVPVLGAMKLALVLVAAALPFIHPYGFYLAFIAAAAAAFVAVQRMWGIRLPARSTGRDYATVFHYAKWITLSTFLFLLMQRADIFLIGAFLTPDDVGKYGLAVLLVSAIDYVTVAIKTVLLPDITQSRRLALVSGTGHAAALIGLIFVLLLVPYHYLGSVLAILFPAKAHDLLVLVRPLFWAAVLCLWCDPLLLSLYRQNRPFILGVSNAIALVAAVALNVWLLPVHGVVAAAYVAVISRAISRAIQFAYAVALVWRTDPFLGPAQPMREA